MLAQRLFLDQKNHPKKQQQRHQGSTIGDGAIVESGAMVAAGASVPAGAVVKSGTLVGGAPARELRPLKAEEASFLPVSAKKYAELAAGYAREGLGA